MKKMLTLLLLIIMAPISLSHLARLPVNKNLDAQSARVDELFSEWDEPDSPGCSLAIIKDGKIIYSRGYGMADLEHGIPISPRTVFYIGSVSKQFVTMSVALLAEQGKLHLDDDIRKYLPEFPDYGNTITIRHLIHHTSGIRDYLTLWSLSGKSYFDHMPVDAVLELIYNQKELNFAPGEQHLYSNSCYFLLSEIVRNASGKSLRQFAHQNIFKPLGMHNSHFHDDNKHLIKNRAFGYGRNDEGAFDNLIMRFDLVGSGGLYTTVEDLYLWDQNFYDNKLGKGRAELIDLMLTNGRLNNGEEVNYAFALRSDEYRGLKTVSHSGSLGGYRAQLLRFPEQKFSVAILANLAGFNPSALSYQVADVFLADRFVERGAVQSTTEELSRENRTAIEIDPAIYDAYVGRYMSERGLVINIAQKDAKLILEWPGLPKIELLPESKTRFFQTFDEDVFEFVPDASGEVSQLNVAGGGREILYTRVLNLPSDQLAEYAGDYRSHELEATHRLLVEDEILFLKVGHSPQTRLDASRRDIFFANRNKAVFQRTRGGKISGFVLDAGRVKNLKFVRK